MWYNLWLLEVSYVRDIAASPLPVCRCAACSWHWKRSVVQWVTTATLRRFTAERMFPNSVLPVSVEMQSAFVRRLMLRNKPATRSAQLINWSLCRHRFFLYHFVAFSLSCLNDFKCLNASQNVHWSYVWQNCSSMDMFNENVHCIVLKWFKPRLSFFGLLAIL